MNRLTRKEKKADTRFNEMQVDEKQKENNNWFRRTKFKPNYLQKGVMGEPNYSMEV